MRLEGGAFDDGASVFNTWSSSADKAPRASRLTKARIGQRAHVGYTCSAIEHPVGQGSPAIARPPIRPKCNGKRRHQPCRSPNERRRRTRTTDEAYTEAPYKRSYGRSENLALLYNEVRPYGAIGNKPPVSVITPAGAPSPPT